MFTEVGRGRQRRAEPQFTLINYINVSLVTRASHSTSAEFNQEDDRLLSLSHARKREEEEGGGAERERERERER